MDRCFVDTNVFFYACDTRAPAKYVKATELLAYISSQRTGYVSFQVIHEFACNALTKLRLEPDVIASLCNSFDDYTLVRPDVDLVKSALRLTTMASVSFWDACIIAAAQKADCRVLYTEDLSHGQRFGPLRVVNPFR